MAGEEHTRTCHKTGCRWPAAASLSFRYGSRQVWLLDLTDEADPSLYDLCPDHADALTVPRGWDRVEQRTEVVAASAQDDKARTADATTAVGDGVSRYEVLRATLPRVAAEVAARQQRAYGTALPAPAGSPAPLEPVGDPEASTKVRELTPQRAVARQAPPGATGAVGDPPTPEPSEQEAAVAARPAVPPPASIPSGPFAADLPGPVEELPGQLSLGVIGAPVEPDDVVGLPPGDAGAARAGQEQVQQPGGVVVEIEFGRPRGRTTG